MHSKQSFEVNVFEHVILTQINAFRWIKLTLSASTKKVEPPFQLNLLHLLLCELYRMFNNEAFCLKIFNTAKIPVNISFQLYEKEFLIFVKKYWFDLLTSVERMIKKIKIELPVNGVTLCMHVLNKRICIWFAFRICLCACNEAIIRFTVRDVNFVILDC